MIIGSVRFHRTAGCPRPLPAKGPAGTADGPYSLQLRTASHPHVVGSWPGAGLLFTVAPAGDRHLSGRWLGTRRVGIAPTAVRESMASMLRAHWRLGSRVMTEVFIPDDELARKAGAPVPGAI